MAWFLLLIALAALLWVHRHHAAIRRVQAADLTRLREELSGLYAQREGLRTEAAALRASKADLETRVQVLTADVAALSAFQEVRDLAAEAQRIRLEAQELIAAAELEAHSVRSRAGQEAEELHRQATAAHADASRKTTALLDQATAKAAGIVSAAEAEAENVAGDAYRALRELKAIQRTATAIENLIGGYGDRYLVPTYSFLDEFAETYSFEDAGRDLKLARDQTKRLVASGAAAACDYVEAARRSTAIHFVLDAFNGKVDTILARIKADNVGTLRQQIEDSFAVVNHNGKAFRNARVTPEYLTSRLEELKWAAAAMALRERDKEEQRQAREQIREEERARREIERALRDTEREEAAIQKAMVRLETQVAKANDDQRLALEVQLADLRNKLSEAEARNQRALSMAQQTKAGHVYIISNIGSFGENVYKVGMTRRLEPHDRVRELGDASVPFNFDVHAMIWSEDAPTLERALHRRFVTAQVNKVNPRKEFFRVDLASLRDCVEDMGLQCAWTLAASAAQYRETQAIERDLVAGTVHAQQWLSEQMAFEPEMPLEEETVPVGTTADENAGF
ncbi:DUF4041 domain-containing protein [Pseudoxanthomonas sp. 22568]|uniref:DUF4041 domain-containing protein n=1 Tax=Pseudoxanthomonas sp. 22568 TaxID=3453945 RepID=UPI003F84181C